MNLILVLFATITTVYTCFLLLVNLNTQHWLFEIFINVLPFFLILSIFNILFQINLTLQLKLEINKLHSQLRKTLFTILVIILLGIGFSPSILSFSKIYNFHLKGQGTKNYKIDEIRQKLNSPLKSEGNIKTAFFNKLYTNENYEAINNKLIELDPDIIGFAEFRLVDAKNISYLEEYPYQFLPLIRNEFETKVAIYSKFPIEEYKSPKSILSHLTAKIKVKERIFYYVVLHMSAPVSQDFFILRNRQINEATQIINNIEENLQKGESLVVMGDLNLSPWSNYYKKFTNQTNLVNIAESQGINYTWEYKSLPKALEPLLSSQIDHIFTSKNLLNAGLQTESNLGSDHKLIWTYLL